MVWGRGGARWGGAERGGVGRGGAGRGRAGQGRTGQGIDVTVSIGPSLCSMTEWSVSVAGTECWFS